MDNRVMSYDERDSEGLDRMTNDQLMHEYREMRKAGFNSMFGHNARRRCDACADMLIARGVTMEPSIFGESPISFWSY